MHGSLSTGILGVLGSFAALLVVMTGCTAGSLTPPPDETTEEVAVETPQPSTSGAAGRKASIDLSNLPIAREPFCDRLDPDRVEEVLSGPVLQTAHYGNGEDASLAPGTTDVSHEHGCVFEGTSPTTARAWVFARPVRQDEARALVRDARRAGGCTTPSSIGFGTPDVLTVCRRRASSPVLRLRFQGLFTDSWVSCELTVPRSTTPLAAQRRTERWCLHVATTLGARP